MVVKKSSEDFGVDDNDVEIIRRGSRERAIGVAVVTVALSSGVAWFLVDAGYGVVSSLLIVWMFGNLLFLGLAYLARVLTRSRARRGGVRRARSERRRDEEECNPDLA